MTARVCPAVEYELEDQKIERRLPCTEFDFETNRERFLNEMRHLSDRYEEIARQLKAEASANSIP